MTDTRFFVRKSLGRFALAFFAFPHGVCAQQVETPRSALASYDFSGDAAVTWELPRRLREISGLTLSSSGRLLAHDDEIAVIYEYDYVDGELTKAFAFGDATARGDFEGIARTPDGRVYLITSDGRLHESSEGNDGDRLLYNIYGTSAGRACEIEGLTAAADPDHLMMICKTPIADYLKDQIAIYKWSRTSHTMADDSLLRIPLSQFTSRLEDDDDFNPSGITYHPNGNLLIVAARQSAIAEVTPSGRVVAVRNFRRRAHRQVEGVIVGPNGTLILADEGRSGRARITVYRPRPSQ